MPIAAPRSVTLPEETLPEETSVITTSHDPDAAASAPLLTPPLLLPAAAPVAVVPPASHPPPAHPLCSRSLASPPIVPSQVIAQQPTRPKTRSMTGLPRNSGASWSDVVTKVDADIAASTPTPRPRGRPPSNHTWDADRGQYVPINFAASINKAWILATMHQELIADHVTPTSIEDAFAGPDADKWKAAVAEELESLHQCAV